jgi:hypothetical protein
MSKRKPCNRRVQVDRALRSLLKANHVAVVCIETTERQGLINWKNCKSIAPSQKIADAVCDIAHRWTILVGVMCQTPDGSQYLRSEEASPQGVYLAAHLSDVIAKVHDDFLAGANPNQVVTSGWLAVPNDVTISEAQAAKVFAAVGGWQANQSMGNQHV